MVRYIRHKLVVYFKKCWESLSSWVETVYFMNKKHATYLCTLQCIFSVFIQGSDQEISDKYVCEKMGNILFTQRKMLLLVNANKFKIARQQHNKVQLISKCLFGVIVWTKILSGFLPWNFCSFLGASCKLFGLPGDLVSNIINKEGYWKPKKLPGSPQKATKNFRAEIQKYFRWYFGWNWFFIRTFWN